MAAAAVFLEQPAYVLEDVDFTRAVLIAEGVAVSALVMCLCFVMANSPGTPTKWWRLTPVIGLLNWPSSMLAWDVIMLNGYLALNVLIPFYILFSHFTGREPDKPTSARIRPACRCAQSARRGRSPTGSW